MSLKRNRHLYTPLHRKYISASLLQPYAPHSLHLLMRPITFGSVISVELLLILCVNLEKLCKHMEVLRSVPLCSCDLHCSSIAGSNRHFFPHDTLLTIHLLTLTFTCCSRKQESALHWVEKNCKRSMLQWEKVWKTPNYEFRACASG